MPPGTAAAVRQRYTGGKKRGFCVHHKAHYPCAVAQGCGGTWLTIGGQCAGVSFSTVLLLVTVCIHVLVSFDSGFRFRTVAQNSPAERVPVIFRISATTHPPKPPPVMRTPLIADGRSTMLLPACLYLRDGNFGKSSRIEVCIPPSVGPYVANHLLKRACRFNGAGTSLIISGEPASRPM